MYTRCIEKERGAGERLTHLYCSNVMHGNIFNEIRVFPPATFPLHPADTLACGQLHPLNTLQLLCLENYTNGNTDIIKGLFLLKNKVGGTFFMKI